MDPLLVNKWKRLRNHIGTNITWRFYIYVHKFVIKIVHIPFVYPKFVPPSNMYLWDAYFYINNLLQVILPFASKLLSGTRQSYALKFTAADCVITFVLISHIFTLAPISIISVSVLIMAVVSPWACPPPQ